MIGFAFKPCLDVLQLEEEEIRSRNTIGCTVSQPTTCE